MPWDSDKSTASDPDNPTADEQLTADEWDNHVIDQKNRGYNSLTTVTTNHTASTQEIVLADASGGALTVTLPSPEASTSVMVKKTDSSSNAVTIATPNTETIDGDSSRTITGENVTREIVSDGTNYFVLYSVLDSSDSGVVDADVNNSSTETGKLSYGGTRTAADVDSETLASSGVSTTNTTYTEVGDRWGMLIPAGELYAGTMELYIRFTGRLSIGDGTETASLRLQYWNQTDGWTTITGTEVTSSSTTDEPVDSGWVDLGNAITTESESFMIRAQLKTSNSTYSASVKNAAVSIAKRPPA